VVFSIYLLLRGHNLPGGGFIGGLVLASALVLRVMVDPERALASAMLPVLLGRTFFTGLWGGEIWLPAIGPLKLGTPLLFDTGVFLVVTAVAAKMLLVLLAQTRKSEP
jgi:multicomponent Na+:H+ antiporter subunit B